MTLWFVFALMTVAAIFAVLWPLSRGTAPQAGGSEAAVYRDQLAEIDRDVAAGLIGVSEAEAARVEIGRRLLAAADGERDLPARSNLGLRRASAVVALVGLPIAAVTFYLSLGSPRLGDFPLAVAHPHRGRQSAARQHGGAGRSASGKKSDRRPRLDRAGAGAGAARPLRRRGPRLSQFDHLRRRQRRAPLRSRRSPCRCRGRRRDGGGQGRVRARGRAERRRAQGKLFPRACGRTGWPQRRRRLDLARHARQGARRMRRGGRWSRPRWRGSAVRPRRRCPTTRWPPPRT